MPAFLMASVGLGDRVNVQGWKRGWGVCLMKCTKCSYYGLIFRAVPSDEVSCSAHLAACSETVIVGKSQNGVRLKQSLQEKKGNRRKIWPHLDPAFRIGAGGAEFYFQLRRVKG